MFPALEGLEIFYEIALSEFVSEQRKHKYKKYTENPYYDQLKAFVDSINPLRRYFGFKALNLSQVVKREIERGEKNEYTNTDY